MTSLTRFGVSLEKSLLETWDKLLQQKGYTNRSEALRDIIRQELVKQEWHEGKEVVGAITLVYDHHKRELVNTLTQLQHDFGGMIIASQHIHLDHHNCLEIVAVRGNARKVRGLAEQMRSTKGVKHGTLSMTTSGRTLV